MTRNSLRQAAALGLTVGLLAVTVPAASAKTGDVRRSGTCSRSATWKLKASPENGRVEVEAEVDSNVVGQAWSVVIRDNGVAVASATGITLAPSGSFSINRVIANRAGTDVISLRATNARTGEVCTGSLSYTD